MLTLRPRCRVKAGDPLLPCFTLLHSGIPLPWAAGTGMMGKVPPLPAAIGLPTLVAMAAVAVATLAAWLSVIVAVLIVLWNRLDKRLTTFKRRLKPTFTRTSGYPMLRRGRLGGLMVNARKSLSSCQLARDGGLNTKTAWFRQQPIRAGMAAHQDSLPRESPWGRSPLRRCTP